MTEKPRRRLNRSSKPGGGPLGTCAGAQAATLMLVQGTAGVRAGMGTGYMYMCALVDYFTYYYRY